MMLMMLIMCVLFKDDNMGLAHRAKKNTRQARIVSPQWPDPHKSAARMGRPQARIKEKLALVYIINYFFYRLLH